MSTSTRIPEGERVRPRVIFSPECRCDAYDLRVRYGSGDRPAWARRVDGETVRMLDRAEATSGLLDLDQEQPGTGTEAHGGDQPLPP